MQDQTPMTTPCIKSLLTKAIIMFSILIIASIFILPRNNRLYKHEDARVVTMAETVRICARNTVVEDVKGAESNDKLAVPYTGRDVLKMVTPPYSADYKNPCWVDEHSQKLRCLPYFILAGVAKSGTTNLYFSIGQHLQVRLPKEKEPQWWARGAYRTPLVNYVKSFDVATKEIQTEYKMKDGKKYHRLVTGDGSPSTSYEFFSWQLITQNANCSGEPGVVTPHLVRHIIPQAKLIFILRNPADRLIAGYIHWRRKERCTPGHFHQQCVIRLRQFTQCRRLHTDRHCTFNSKPVVTHRFRIQRSLYSVSIKEWLRVFPREQLHFVQYEDFVQNKSDVLKGVFRFLKLDPVHTIDMEEETKGINPHKFKMAPMLNKTRNMLDAFFKPYNEELSILIGDPKFKFLNTQIPQNNPSGKNEILPEKKTVSHQRKSSALIKERRLVRFDAKHQQKYRKH